MKPSERVLEIHRAKKILDGQDPEDKNFNNISFFEESILQYLDEKELGTGINQRRTPPKNG